MVEKRGLSRLSVEVWPRAAMRAREMRMLGMGPESQPLYLGQLCGSVCCVGEPFLV